MSLETRRHSTRPTPPEPSPDEPSSDEPSAPQSHMPRPLSPIPAPRPSSPDASGQAAAGGQSNPDASPAPLSLRLRVATSQAHRLAEQRTFVTDLMAGRLTAAAHLDLSRQYLPIYAALEHAGRQLIRTAAGPIVALKLDREPALRSDLAALGGLDIDILPAAARYAEHLASLAANPGGWTAHAYARYLGDLSGGQAIASALRRHYGLPDAVLGFYSFPGSVPRLREEFRARLDAMALTPTEARIAEDEARLAFEAAGALFDQLSARHRR